MFLFPGVPGGLELLVILLIMVVLFGVPVAVVLLGVVLLGRSRGDGDVETEVAALREEVAELRAAMESRDGGEETFGEGGEETFGEGREETFDEGGDDEGGETDEADE